MNEIAHWYISLPQTRLINNGITTVSYFSTIHQEATKILVDLVHDLGQRALIGKVNMVRLCPCFYRDKSVQESIRETEEIIHYIKGKRVGSYGVSCSIGFLIHLILSLYQV